MDHTSPQSSPSRRGSPVAPPGANGVSPAPSRRVVVGGRRRRVSPFVGALTLGLTVGLMATVLASGPARADLRMCNQTASKVGIALGYRDPQGWVTEGWWDVAPRACETLLKGALAARFYYVFAVDYTRGGEWNGRSLMCTKDREFTIRGSRTASRAGSTATASTRSIRVSRRAGRSSSPTRTSRWRRRPKGGPPIVRDSAACGFVSTARSASARRNLRSQPNFCNADLRGPHPNCVDRTQTLRGTSRIHGARSRHRRHPRPGQQATRR